MGELLPLFLAGLAFFFMGVSGISANLRQMSGRGLRRLLGKATNKPLSAGACGFLFGMLTQSSSAVAFILSGMIATGLISLGSALPVLTAANVGTSILVFLAALDIKIAIFWLLALSGLSISFKWTGRYTAAAYALFFMGLLFYGLHMMKAAFEPLPEYEGFQHLAAFMQSWPYAPFLLGVLLRMAIQSSSAIGVISVTLAAGGLLSEFQAMLLISGSGVGVAFATYFMSGNLKGVSRQIILFQALINAASGITIATLLILDRLTGGHIHWLPGDLGDRVASLFLFMMLGCWFFGTVTIRWMPKWLEKLSPTTPEQDLSRPEFIYDEALKDADTAVGLANREIRRILQLLPHYCDLVRASKGPVKDLHKLHEAAIILSGEVENFLEDLIGQRLSSNQSKLVLSQKRLLQVATQLEDNVSSFADALLSAQWSTGRPQLANDLCESLDTIALTSLDTIEDPDALNIDMLLKMTADRGEMMERIRHNVHNKHGSVEDHSQLHYLTTLFERNVWLLRQVALWAKANQAIEAED